MNLFLTLAFLFCIGSVLGWGLEVIFRRFFSAHHWVNPGFLVGPYLPLYGSSLCVLYLLAMRTRWGAGHLLTGILLGGLNFANIYTYIRAHQALPGSPTLIFSVMNMGVIVLGTLVGALLFREKLSPTNLLGVGLALGAIAVMVP